MTADRHPSVIFINAITAFPQITERRCYPDEAAAFDDMCDYRPFNNTEVVASRCGQVHCPHGCVTPGPRSAPVPVQPFRDDIKDPFRFRCPACRSEFTPGQPPGITVEDLAATFRRIGLTGISFGVGGINGPSVTGIIPPGNRDAAGWVIKVTESHPRVQGADPGVLTEPLLLTLTDPHDGTDADVHDNLTVAAVETEITRYL